MKKLKVSLFVLMLLGALPGCSDFYAGTIGNQQSIAYQADRLIGNANLLYRSAKEVPDGDITKAFVMMGGTYTPPPIQGLADSRSLLLNKIDIGVMSRLKSNRESGAITNEFGGQVRMIAKDGSFTAVYTNLPSDIDCSVIPNVTCEHALERSDTGTGFAAWALIFLLGLVTGTWVGSVCEKKWIERKRKKEGLDDLGREL